MNITFDIETIPSQDPTTRAELAADISPPGNISKAETIAAWIADKKPAIVDEALAKTSFDGALGQIVVIGWAIDDEPAQSLQADDLSRAAEAMMLRRWFDALPRGNSGRRPVLIGHNSNAFDIPFLWKRAIVHGIRPPLWFPRDPKPWGEATFDTMTAWAGAKDRISMDRLCRTLGIPGKGGMDGSQVWPYVQAERIDEVAEYCRGDVERTRAIYKRITFANAAAPELAVPSF
jgi:hypothetical protein